VNEIRDLPALWVALDKLLKEGADVNPITFGAANGGGSGSSSSGFSASMGESPTVASMPCCLQYSF
jgi:hypothetical protein